LQSIRLVRDRADSAAETSVAAAIRQQRPEKARRLDALAPDDERVIQQMSARAEQDLRGRDRELHRAGHAEERERPACSRPRRSA
jgi:hypothetical protein